MTRLAAAVLAALLAVAAGCTAASPDAVVLRVLATSELADVAPLLHDLRAATGVDLRLDLRDDADLALRPGRYDHELAWLSSDRSFVLRLAAAEPPVPAPPGTPILLSPLAVGVTGAAAARLGPEVSWVDLADAAAGGELRFAMADPRSSGEGLAALVGVATAAAGTGRALRPEDVRCDRLRGFFTGQALTAPGTPELVERFVAGQADLDAIIAPESTLVRLAGSGRLSGPLEIRYPADGIVQATHPLLLLDPAQQAAYDRVVAWLLSPAVQQRLTDETARRPVVPGVTRNARLPATTGNALYFPDRLDVLDALLADYTAGLEAEPGDVLFVLDFSGSMRGERIAALRRAMADLTGAGAGSLGRFRAGERITVLRFGGEVLNETDVPADDPARSDAVRAAVAVDPTADRTAMWTAVGRAYDLAAARRAERPRRPVSVVLMTDGKRNAGLTADEFLARIAGRPDLPPLLAIRVGDADAAELGRVVAATGGRLVDATAPGLPAAFSEVRACD